MKDSIEHTRLRSVVRLSFALHSLQATVQIAYSQEAFLCTRDSNVLVGTRRAGSQLTAKTYSQSSKASCLLHKQGIPSNLANDKGGSLFEFAITISWVIDITTSRTFVTLLSFSL